MTKTRKTRKQKEESAKRKAIQTQHAHLRVDSPTYSVTSLPTKKTVINTPQNTRVAIEQADAAYLKKDIVSITAASGIILAFDALLLILLLSNTLHLNFLGY